MTKILFLGGSAQQTSVLQYAKSCGYFSILCDYLDDNPGIEIADKFYLVSTTDYDKVMEVATDNEIDGIISYASDPAAIIAAKVSAALGLKSNSINCVYTLSDKQLFRKFLKENDLNYPKTYMYQSYDQIGEGDSLDFPIMVKPVDSSGSKGVTKVLYKEQLEDAISLALDQSRTKKIIIEDYISMDHPYMIGGDGFVSNGELIFVGLINSHRSKWVNPLVPIGNSYPAQISKKREAIVIEELKKVLKVVGFENGAFNLEIMFDAQDKLYFIEIGPRNGGNRIPEFLKYIYGFDMIKNAVENLTTQICKENININSNYFINYVLHSRYAGRYVGFIIKEGFEKYKIYENITAKPGVLVEKFNGSNQSLGIIVFEFDNKEAFDDAVNSFDDLVQILCE